MRHFFTHKEIKLKKKRTAIAVIGIGLVLGIYFTSNPQLSSSASFLRLNVLSSLN